MQAATHSAMSMVQSRMATIAHRSSPKAAPAVTLLISGRDWSEFVNHWQKEPR